ncbi:hypothetical protein DITRI_Ditri10aG0064400 [Diplodiscus trichospermus]
MSPSGFKNTHHTNSHLSLKTRNLLNHNKRLRQGTSNKTTTKASNVVSSSSNNNNSIKVASNSDSLVSDTGYGRFPCNSVKQIIQRLDGAHRADLSNCIGELEPATWQFGQSCASSISTGFDQNPLNQGVQLAQDAGLVSYAINPELLEFERLKVERQISASLYAMKGVNEYLENAFDHNGALWDFPIYALPVFQPNLTDSLVLT